MKTKSHLKLRALCEGAIMVALAYVLSFIKLFELPQGGSIDIGMLPIFLYCARWGFGPGLLAASYTASCSFCRAVVSLSAASLSAGSPSSATTSWPTAARSGRSLPQEPLRLLLGVLVGGLARFLSHYITGATLWAEYMPDTFFGMTMTSPWFYSALYNGSYMLVDMIVCVVVGWALWKPLGKYIRGEDLQK